MNFYWVYDIPSPMFWLLCVGISCTIGVSGTVLLRSWVKNLHGGHSHNEIVSVFFASLAVFYGVAMGLFCVTTWQTFSDIESKVAIESATLASLYRDVSHLDEPLRTRLQDDLRTYTRNVIDVAWPAQRRGESSAVNGPLIEAFYDSLASYEPRTEAQKAIYKETLQQFNRLIELRRLRLQSVGAGLPSSMWVLIVLGAVVTLACCWFFDTQSLRMHLWLTVMLAVLLGMLVNLLVAVDNPFRGAVSVEATPFEMVYRDVMAPQSAAPH